MSFSDYISPHKREKLLHLLATTEKLKVDGLNNDYYNCLGLTQKTANIDLTQIISNFPAMIVLLIYCFLLPIIGFVCCSLVFARSSSLKFETRRTRRIRICCYVLLVIFVVLMSYCLWLMLKSIERRLSPYLTRPLAFTNESYSPADYIEMVNVALPKNLSTTADYFKQVLQDLHNFTNQTNEVAIKQLQPITQSVSPLVVDIRHNLYLLISDMIEFVDSLRFYYRNGTNYLSSGAFDLAEADFSLLNEMRVSIQHLKQLYCMNQLIENIIEIFKTIVETDHLRESALISIRKSHDRFVDFMDDLWEPKDSDLNVLRLSLLKWLVHLDNLPSDDVLFLPSRMHNSAIVACVIVSLIISLIVLLLCGEIISKITGKGKRCIKWFLLSVIGIILLSSSVLGFIMALHFSFGVIVNNFQRSLYETTTEICNDATDLYCQTFDNVNGLVGLNTEEEKEASRNESMNNIMNQEIGNYKQSMAIWANPYNQKMQLSTEMNGCVGNFLDENVFTTLFEELSIDDLNMTLERFTAIDIDASLPIHDLREITLCNLEVMRKRVFGRLLGDRTRKLVLSLSHDAQLLASRLPENLGPLLQQAQIEVSELQFMYINEFSETLTPLTTLMADVYKEKLKELQETLFELPDCLMVRGLQLGTSLEKYHEMEDMEHCLWIGLMLVLFIIGPLLVVLLILLHLHKRMIVVIPRNTDSVIPKRWMRPMVTLNDSTTVMEVPNYEYDQSNETEQPSASQPSTSQPSISQPAKRKHALQIELEDETGVNDARCLS